jgi:hypothetical protein
MIQALVSGLNLQCLSGNDDVLSSILAAIWRLWKEKSLLIPRVRDREGAVSFYIWLPDDLRLQLGFPVTQQR